MNESICEIVDCGAPVMVSRSGKPFRLCQEHQRAVWRSAHSLDGLTVPQMRDLSLIRGKTHEGREWWEVEDIDPRVLRSLDDKDMITTNEHDDGATWVRITGRGMKALDGEPIAEATPSVKKPDVRPFVRKSEFPSNGNNQRPKPPVIKPDPTPDDDEGIDRDTFIEALEKVSRPDPAHIEPEVYAGMEREMEAERQYAAQRACENCDTARLLELIRIMYPDVDNTVDIIQRAEEAKRQLETSRVKGDTS